MATVTVAVRMGAVGMTAAARVAGGTAAGMEVLVKGLPRVVAAKTTAGRKAWKRVVAAGGATAAVACTIRIELAI